MADQQAPPAGPDLSQGIALSEFSGATLLGHVGDEDVLLVRSGSEVFAIGAHCSHYHGPLAEGLVDGESIRCPWHHACFDVRTGEAARAPALNSIAVWKVEPEGNRIFVRQKREQPKPRVKGALDAPGKIVIVGGGAAGFAAAEMLRRQDYRGSIVMLSKEAAAPVDRPNLSKDYLAGSAPEDWLPLRPDDFYSGAAIDLRLNTEVTSIDAKAKAVVLAGGGGDRGDARARRHAIEMNRARAAQRHAASELRAGHAEYIAQRPQKARVIRHIDGECLTIHVQCCAHRGSLFIMIAIEFK